MVIHQDMPPPGGFARINIERTFAKPFIKQGIWIVILGAMTLNGGLVLKDFRKKLRIFRMEQLEHFIAVQPFMYAEQERKFLRHLRNSREDERELMKDHPGWQVGTLYGERIFKTLPKDVLPPINHADYTAHNPEWVWFRHFTLPDQHA